jgi:hypothetical protein
MLGRLGVPAESLQVAGEVRDGAMGQFMSGTEHASLAFQGVRPISGGVGDQNRLLR